MSSKPNLADGELNPRSKLRLKLTTQRLTDEGRFPPKCTFRRGAFYPTFWPTWSLSPRTVRERHRLSDGVQSIGSIPAVTSAFVTSVCNARLRVHINTHTHTHRRRSRCIVVDFESRSIKPPTGARARALTYSIRFFTRSDWLLLHGAVRQSNRVVDKLTRYMLTTPAVIHTLDFIVSLILARVFLNSSFHPDVDSK